MSADCVFCKIAQGEIPSVKIYEDECVLAFLDIAPLSDGHTLVIPKKHFEKMDEMPGQTIAEVAKRLPKIAEAIINALDCDGYNLLCNRSRAAGQLVDHVHFHLIPRSEGDGVFTEWKSKKYPEGKAEQLAEKIRKSL